MANWPHDHVRERKKRPIATPQVQALRKRAKRGLGPATPEQTQQRINTLKEYIRNGVLCRSTMRMLAEEWCVSFKRVQQLCVEARRQNG